MTSLWIPVVTLFIRIREYLYAVCEWNCIIMGETIKSGKIVKITTRNQFGCLVNLMDENPQVAKGFYKSPDKNYLRNFWKQTAIKLNSLGPPVRDGEGWQKVWNDYKLKTKKKWLYNRQLKAKGAPSYRQHIFSKLEETTIKLMCLEKTPVPIGRAFELTANQDLTIGVISPVHNNASPKTANDSLNGDCEATRNSFSENQNPTTCSVEDIKPSTSLLQRSENQTTSRAECSCDIHHDTNIYVSIAESLKNIEDSSKEAARIWQRILAIKEEKLEIYKRNLQEKADYRREKQKLRQNKTGT